MLPSNDQLTLCHEALHLGGIASRGKAKTKLERRRREHHHLHELSVHFINGALEFGAFQAKVHLLGVVDSRLFQQRKVKMHQAILSCNSGVFDILIDGKTLIHVADIAGVAVGQTGAPFSGRIDDFFTQSQKSN